MQFGLNRLNLRSPATFAASAARAEALGWDVGLTPVSPLLAADPYVLLAAAAAATTTLRLGTLLENPVMRHPAVIAGSTATVAALAPGRVMATLGVGDTAVRLAGMRPATVDGLRDAMVMIRRLLAGEPHPLPGGGEALLRHRARDAAPAPVWIAAGGPRALAMAGAVADGVFIRVGTHPANLRAAVDAVQQGARAAGRDPSAVAIGLIVHTIVSRDADRLALATRAMAAGYYEYAPYLFAAPGFTWDGPPVHELKQRVWPDFHHATDLLAAGREVTFLPDAAADAFCLHGDWPAIRAGVADLQRHVPEAALLVPHPVPDHGSATVPPADYVEAFAREVIAPLRAATPATARTTPPG